MRVARAWIAAQAKGGESVRLARHSAGRFARERGAARGPLGIALVVILALVTWHAVHGVRAAWHAIAGLDLPAALFEDDTTRLVNT